MTSSCRILAGSHSDSLFLPFVDISARFAVLRSDYKFTTYATRKVCYHGNIPATTLRCYVVIVMQEFMASMKNPKVSNMVIEVLYM